MPNRTDGSEEKMGQPAKSLPLETPAPSSPWRRLVPLAVIAAGLIGAYAFDLHKLLSFEALAANREGLLAWTGEHFAAAVLIYVATYALAAAFSIPGAVWLTLAGGFIFGTWGGTLYTVIGATIGALGIYLAARFALRDYFAAKAGGALRRMEAGFRENAFSYLLVLRLIPLFPFWLVNLVPALLGVSTRTYILATFIGIIPGTFVYTSVGNGLGAVFEQGGKPDLGIIFSPQIMLPIIGLSLLALLPVGYRHWREHKGAR